MELRIGCTICSVQVRAKSRIWEFLAQVIMDFGYFLKVVYIALFGWWLDPWLQQKENRALLDDIRTNLNFLITSSPIDFSKQVKNVRSCAEVRIPWENLLVIVTRWHGETNVRVAPRHAPNDRYEIGPLIAALERRRLSEHDVVNDLVSAAKLLQPRLQALNEAFSEQEYRQTKALGVM